MSTPSLLPPGYFTARVEHTDPVIAEAIAREKTRTRGVIELIASENIVSRAVLDVQGSILTNKTVEGYPGKRYHAGAVNVDVVERTAIDRASQLFGCRCANVQPHSGSQANHAVLHAVAEPGETILSMDLNAGGHLSHGAVGQLQRQMVPGRELWRAGRRRADRLRPSHRPRAPAPAPTRHRGWLGLPARTRLRRLPPCRRRGRREAGWSTWRTSPAWSRAARTSTPSLTPTSSRRRPTSRLRGPRGAIILWNDEALTKRINHAVFPGLQGTPRCRSSPPRRWALGEALRPEFATYAAAVLANARALAARLQRHGFDLVGGGTDTPLMLVDLRAQGLAGAPAAQSLERAGIIANMNPIPSDAAT